MLVWLFRGLGFTCGDADSSGAEVYWLRLWSTNLRTRTDASASCCCSDPLTPGCADEADYIDLVVDIANNIDAYDGNLLDFSGDLSLSVGFTPPAELSSPSDHGLPHVSTAPTTPGVVNM